MSYPPDNAVTMQKIRRQRVRELRMGVLRAVLVMLVFFVLQLFTVASPPAQARLGPLVHDGQGQLWLGLGGQLWVGSPSGHTRQFVTGVPGPYAAMCAYGPGVAVVSDSDAHVTLLDANGHITGTLFPPKGGARALAYNAASQVLYVLLKNEDTLLAYRNGQVWAQRRHVANWGGLSLTADGTLWIADREQRRFLVLTPDLSRERIIPLAGNAVLYPLVTDSLSDRHLHVLLAPMPPFNTELDVLDAHANRTFEARPPWWVVPSAFTFLANGDALIADSLGERLWRVHAGQSSVWGDAPLYERLQSRRWYRWTYFANLLGARGAGLLGAVIMLVILGVEACIRLIVRRQVLRAPVPKVPVSQYHLFYVVGVLLFLLLACWLPSGGNDDWAACFAHWYFVPLMGFVLVCAVLAPPRPDARRILQHAQGREDVAKALRPYGVVQHVYAESIPRQSDPRHFFVFTETAFLDILLGDLDFSLQSCTAMPYADIRAISSSASPRWWKLSNVNRGGELSVCLQGDTRSIHVSQAGLDRTLAKMIHRYQCGRGGRRLSITPTQMCLAWLAVLCWLPWAFACVMGASWSLENWGLMLLANLLMGYSLYRQPELWAGLWFSPYQHRVPDCLTCNTRHF